MDTWVRIADGVRTRSAILERAMRAATGLQSVGVRRGDVIALCLRNDFPLLEASQAAGMLGAYVVPVNWHNTVEETRHVLTNSGAKVVVIHSDLLHTVGAAIPEDVIVIGVATSRNLLESYRLPGAHGTLPEGVEDWDSWLARFEPKEPPYETAPGSMIYTSGTTGKPKGVRRAAPASPEHAEALLATTRLPGGLVGWEDRMHEVVMMVPGPAYHSSPNGWMSVFYKYGANLVVEQKFDAERLLSLIERHRVTHLLAVPTMFIKLLALPEETRRKYDLSSLTFVMHVGAPCPPHVKRAMIDWWGPIITEHYGSTEVGTVTMCTSEEWLAHPGTVGRVLPGIDLQVLDASGNPVPVGESGEIACRRVDVASDFTYHGDDDKRRSASRGELVATGDIGYLDADGFLYLDGRNSDMIIFGGTNIYPAEIESALMLVPGVADCAVFGIPDPEFGEQVCAFVQPAPDADLTAESIREGLKGHLASYKIPRRVELVDTLPREDTGKIFKRKLREPFWAEAGRSI